MYYVLLFYYFTSLYVLDDFWPEISPMYCPPLRGCYLPGCSNGLKVDERGCRLCECNDEGNNIFSLIIGHCKT